MILSTFAVTAIEPSKVSGYAPSFTVSKSLYNITLSDSAWEVQPPVWIELGDKESALNFKVRADPEALCVLVDYWHQGVNATKIQRMLEIVASSQESKSARIKIDIWKKEALWQVNGVSPWLAAATKTKLEYLSQSDRVRCLVKFRYDDLGWETPQHGDVWSFNLGLKSTLDDGAAEWNAWHLSTKQKAVLELKPTGTLSFE